MEGVEDGVRGELSEGWLIVSPVAEHWFQSFELFCLSWGRDLHMNGGAGCVAINGIADFGGSGEDDKEFWFWWWGMGREGG